MTSLPFSDASDADVSMCHPLSEHVGASFETLREVDWLDRYCPPEPGYIFLEERSLHGGARLLVAWQHYRSLSSNIICYSEPSASALATSTLMRVLSSAPKKGHGKEA